ncbi:hypothetical protein GA0070616_0068 [Micromonospora nigra]|uniref:Uncharacterized protein n=1 Tax=Micromonospora nigra TaxID=145857 RepID=A0A1C6R7B7_9ACTN|nr:hypothetical protein [Micromonospora nigra]SCL12930.1 hypothetical protein GA0070616_0068 [Micromonospora nigra]
MAVPTAPTMTLPTLPTERRARQVCELLDQARRHMERVTSHLHLCEHAPAWPTAPISDITTAVEFRRAIVELIKYARRHQCADSNPGRMRALLRLAVMCLDLWQTGKRYVYNPNVYPLTLTRRAARMLHDTAAWTTTGQARHLLGQPA